MTDALFTRHLRIAGKVQGVGYRAGFAREAQRLGLHGWVRNRLDGTVEALAQGDAAAVSEIIAWAHHGPGLARVDHVLVTEVNDASITPAGFNVLPTE